MNLNLQTSRCDPDRLESFLRGDLSDAHERELALHLDDCEHCRRELERHAAEPAAWMEAHELLKSVKLDSLVADEASVSHSDKRQTRQPLLIQNVLDALGPTDDPAMLGRMGGYEVSGVVGAGGMGVVLKAVDKSLDRIVAIKVLAPHLATSGAARKRFAREAKAAAAVLHPNVIAIHSVSNDEALPYLVMPYMRGASLQKRLDAEGPLSLSEVLRIGSQIAAGLAAAHAQGLVHRDIKPANILLEEGTERVTITDFGLARAIDDATITHTGAIAGTPQYMSPEQARGEPVDQRSDLFSLGSVLYAMCTGRSPFRAETSYGVLRRITDDQPRPIREINSDIPEWLCGIIDRLMDKQPADRIQSAGEAAELLEQCLAHVQQPTAVPLPRAVALPHQPSRVSGRFGRKPGASARRLIALALVAIAALFAGVVIVLELNKGTLTIESDADDVALKITQGDEVIEKLTVTRGSNNVRIAAGKYVVEIDGKADGIAVENGTVTIERRGSEIVRVVSSPDLLRQSSPSSGETRLWNEFGVTPAPVSPVTAKVLEWIGLHLSSISKEQFREKNVFAQYTGGLDVTFVRTHGPAEKAGIHEVDIVVNLQNKSIASLDDLDGAMQHAVERINRGDADSLEFDVLRSGKTVRVNVPLPVRELGLTSADSVEIIAKQVAEQIEKLKSKYPQLAKFSAAQNLKKNENQSSLRQTNPLLYEILYKNGVLGGHGLIDWKYDEHTGVFLSLNLFKRSESGLPGYNLGDFHIDFMVLGPAHERLHADIEQILKSMGATFTPQPLTAWPVPQSSQQTNSLNTSPTPALPPQPSDGDRSTGDPLAPSFPTTLNPPQNAGTSIEPGTGQEVHDLVWGKTSNGLQAGIALAGTEKRVYSVGEDVPIAVRLRNVSKEPKTITYSSARLRFTRPQIEGPTGERVQVFMPPFVRYVIPTETTSLDPGKEISFGIVKLKLTAEKPAALVDTPHIVASAGEYRITYTVPLTSPGALVTGTLRFHVADEKTGSGEKGPGGANHGASPSSGSSNPPSEVNSQALGFSETNELVLSMDSMKFMLDLDTGKTMDPPATIRPEQEKMDVSTTQVQPYHYPTGLIGHSLRGREVKASDWNASASDVRKAVADNAIEPLQQMDVGPEKTPTYFFKTRDGTEGILQLLAVVDNPKGIRFRYKTLPREQKAQADAHNTLIENMQGDWIVDKLTNGTEDSLAEVTGRRCQLSVRGTLLTFRFYGEKSPEVLRTVLLTLEWQDRTKSHEVDVILDPNGNADRLPGLIECDGTVLKLCMSNEVGSTQRPRIMAPGAKVFYHECRRPPDSKTAALSTTLPAKLAGNSQLANGSGLELRLAYTEPAEGRIEVASPEGKTSVYVEQEPIATSVDVANVEVVDDPAGQSAIQVTFMDEAAARLSEATAQHRGKPVAILFNGMLLSAPTIKEPIGNRAVITGRYNATDVKRLIDAIILGRRVRQFKTEQGVHKIAISTDGKLIAVASGNPTLLLQGDGTSRVKDNWTPVVQILDTTTGNAVARPKLSTAEEDRAIASTPRISHIEATVLSFSPDAAVLAVGTNIGQIKLFNARTGEPVRSLDDEQARLADKETPDSWKVIQRGLGTVGSLAFSPDGNLLAACGDSYAEFSDIFDGIENERLPVTGPGRLKVWDVKTGTIKHDLAGHSQVFGVAFSADGSMLASAGRFDGGLNHDNGVIVWNPESGEKIRTLVINANGGTHAVAFSPNKKLLVAGSRIFDKENDTSATAITVIYPLSGITEWQQSVPGGAKPAFASDGNTIAVLAAEKSVRFLDTQTGNLKHEIKLDHPQALRWNDFALAVKADLMSVGGIEKDGRGKIEVWTLDDLSGALKN